MANSAPAVGSSRSTASMLAEIRCETGNELVMAVRYSCNPPGPSYIPALDAVLTEARPHPGGSSLQRGDLVEIIGPSGSGKTTILNFLQLTTVLPPSMRITLSPPGSHEIEVPLGGRGKHVALLYPTTHRSPILSLAKGIRAHLVASVQDSLATHLRPKTITPSLQGAIDECFKEALERITVVKYKPRSKHLYLALRGLLHPPSLTLSSLKEGEKEKGLELMVIDGFGDGFWPERFAGEERHSAINTRRYTHSIIRGPEEIGMREVIKLIEGIRKELGAVVVLSVQGLWPQGAKTKGKEVDHDREKVMANEGRVKSEVNSGSDDDTESIDIARGRYHKKPKFNPRLYTNFFHPHLPHMPTIPGVNNEDSGSRAWPLNMQMTLRGRNRGLQLPADLTLVDALRSLERTYGDDSASQRFEGIVRVSNGKGAAGTLDGEGFALGIGEDGLEAWAS